MAESGDLLQGRYNVLRRLNQGGMAVVYLASDTRLGRRQVVLKQMDPQALAPQDRGWAEATFRQEAHILARLDHPGLATVTDFFEENGYLYLVMEYVQGETLAATLARSYRLDEQRAIAWGRELAAVLAYLHRQQPPIVFRDLKPENVMVQPDGGLKLIDFGIARFFKPGQSTDTVALGTIGYAAPEQYGRGQTDPRADVYSLGVVLHQLLTGHDPGRTPMNLPPVRELAPHVSLRLAAAIEQALATDPARRFADAVAFAQALAPTAPTPPLSPPASRSRRPFFAAGALLLLLLIAGLVWRLLQGTPDGTPDSAPVAPRITDIPPAGERIAVVEEATAAPTATTALLTTTLGPAAETPTATETPPPTPSPTATLQPEAMATLAPAGTAQPSQESDRQRSYLDALGRYRPSEPIVFAYRGTPPNIDGNLHEWATTAYPIAAVVHEGGSWSGLDDLSGTAYVAWDEANVYIALDVVDDYFVQESSGIMLYQGDSAEVWFDADLFGDFNSNDMNEDDHHIGFSPGRPATLSTESYRWSPRGRQGPVGGQLAAARSDRGYTLEWALPWAALGIIPADGAAFGFTVCLSDNDRAGVQIQESMVCLHGSRQHNQPASLSTLVLIEP